MSNAIGGYRIELTHNITNGIPNDLCRSLFSLLGFQTGVVNDLHNKWTGHFQNNTPDSPFIEFAHSEGGINVNNALKAYDPELRKRIHIIAIASAKTIDRKLCGSVMHFDSSGDFIQCVDMIGRIMHSETVETIPRHPNTKGRYDHSIQSQTFQEPVPAYFYKLINNFK